VTAANRRDHSCTRKIALRIGFELSEAATVTVTVQPVGAKLVRHGRSGANSFTVSGRIGGHTLTPGAYKLIASPSSGGVDGTSHSAKFKIVAT
jgi:hypothetical protein